MAHLFICPNCGNRSAATDRTAGFRAAPKGCAKCGFGFLFELLDDYYPAPDAAFFVCDQQGRVIALRPRRLRADRPRRRARDRPPGRARCSACVFDDEEDPVGTVLEWGVRKLGKPVEVHAEGDLPAPRDRRPLPRLRRRRRHAARPDPAEVRAPARMTDRRRNIFILALHRGARSSRRSVRDRHEADEARPRPQGRHLADLPGQADAAVRRSPARRSTRTIEIMRERIDRFGVAEPEIQRTGADQIDVALPGRRRTPTRRASRSARPPSSTSTTGSRTSSARTASPTRRTRRSRAARRPATAPARAAQYDAVAHRVDVQADEHRQGDDDRRSYYLVDTKTETGRSPGPQRDARPTSRPRPRPRRSPKDRTPRSSRSRRARSSSRRRGDADGNADAARASTCCRTSRRSAAGHQEPRAELRQRTRRLGRAERHVRLHRQGPEGLAGDDARDRPARSGELLRRQRATTRSSTSRSCSTTRSSRRRTSTSSRTRTASTAATAREISGGFTIQSAQDLANLLKTGALPIKLELISPEPGLGDARQAGARPGPDRRASSASLLVSLFLLVFYRVLGVIAVGALGVYALFMLRARSS